MRGNPKNPGSDGASPSYGVCQATEKRVRSFSFFLEQRSCHFLGLKFRQMNHFEPRLLLALIVRFAGGQGSLLSAHVVFDSA
jgi:hypothetical protein